MSKKHDVCYLTGVLCFALAAALPLWVGCSKSQPRETESNAAASGGTCDTLTAVEAYKEDMKNAHAAKDADDAVPAETADADVELPGADGQIKVVAPGTSFDKVIRSAKIVVVDFNATWCGPCRKLGPYLERMAESYKSDGVSFFSVDIDQHRELVEELDIPSIPDVRIYLDGNPVDKVVGCEPIDLMEKIDAVIKNAK